MLYIRGAIEKNRTKVLNDATIIFKYSVTVGLGCSRVVMDAEAGKREIALIKAS